MRPYPKEYWKIRAVWGKSGSDQPRHFSCVRHSDNTLCLRYVYRPFVLSQKSTDDWTVQRSFPWLSWLSIHGELIPLTNSKVNSLAVLAMLGGESSCLGCGDLVLCLHSPGDSSVMTSSRAQAARGKDFLPRHCFLHHVRIALGFHVFDATTIFFQFVIDAPALTPHPMLPETCL